MDSPPPSSSSPSPSSAPAKKYQGRCHCGLFRFTLDIASLNTLWTCTCSICAKNGYLWIHPVQESQLSITMGNEKALHSYHFAMRGTTHLFCPECGSSVMARRRESLPDESLRINARMLEHVNLTNIPVKPFKTSKGMSRCNSQDETTLSVTRSNEVAQDLKKYDGNCHCGQFKFSVQVPEFKSINECDCSVCAMKGYLPLGPAPSANLTVTKGSIAKLSIYGFAGKDHHFCPKCGSAVMTSNWTLSGVQEFAINVRVLRNIDLPSLQTIPSAQPKKPYQIQGLAFPDLTLSDEDVTNGLVKYNGACHCGAVTYTLKTAPLETTKVMSCNCSLCSRNADLFIYPPRSSVLVSLKNLTPYAFLSPDSLHCFCATCGVSVLVHVLESAGDGKKEVEMPINVRTIVGVDVGKLERRFYDGAGNGTLYEV